VTALADSNIFEESCTDPDLRNVNRGDESLMQIAAFSHSLLGIAQIGLRRKKKSWVIKDSPKYYDSCISPRYLINKTPSAMFTTWICESIPHAPSCHHIFESPQ
jgi:hypothetical protein